MERWKIGAEYSGFRLTAPEHGSDVLVSVAGDGPKSRRLTPAKSQRIRNHSPTGFEWGYEGSGPAQLALAILLDFSGQDAELAQHFYQDFKREVVSRFPSSGAGISGGWKIHGSTIANWLRTNGAAGNSWREPGGEFDAPELPAELPGLELPAAPSMLSPGEELARRQRSRNRRGRGSR